MDAKRNNRQQQGPRCNWARRLAWFAGLWLASVLALGVVAFAIRKILMLD